MTTPAVRVLHHALPNAEIHFLTQKPSDLIFEHNRHLSRVITIPPKPSLGEVVEIIRKLRTEKYTISIDFLGLPKTAVIGRLTGANQRIGFHLRGRSMFYTDPIDVPEEIVYSAEQKLHLLSALGIGSTDMTLDFPVSKSDQQTAGSILRSVNASESKPIISISPVSRREYKVWPAENFAAICDYLIETCSAQILFLWGPGEYGFVKDVRDKMKYEALPDYPVPSISETVALLEHVDLHIGNDNGPMHFAIAAGIPTIAIFGRPKAENWTPPGSQRNLAVEFDPGCKDTCCYPKCGLECLRKVTPEEVVEKINILWNQVKK